MTIKITALWNVAPSILVYNYLCFGGKSYLLLPNIKVITTDNIILVLANTVLFLCG